MSTTTEQTTNSILESILLDAKISYAIKLIGPSASPWRDDGGPSVDKYALELQKGKQSASFDFYSSIVNSNWSSYSDKEIAKLTRCKTTRDCDKARSNHKAKRPDLAGILYCLVLDGVEPSFFEDFCGDFGYDADSIKAKKTWEAVQENALKLRKIFSSEDIEKLRIALQDY